MFSETDCIYFTTTLKETHGLYSEFGGCGFRLTDLIFILLMLMDIVYVKPCTSHSGYMLLVVYVKMEERVEKGVAFILAIIQPVSNLFNPLSKEHL